MVDSKAEKREIPYRSRQKAMVDLFDASESPNEPETNKALDFLSFVAPGLRTLYVQAIRPLGRLVRRLYT